MADRRLQAYSKQLQASIHTSSKMTEVCQFKGLPPVQGQPHGCAWGYYASDKTKRDQLGRLNLLTPEVVRKAAKDQIQTGVRVQLDWSMENVQFPGFKRNGFKQTILDKSNPASGWIGCDDEVSYNTQCGSQWDGFRHVCHQQTKYYYNGLSHEELVSGQTDDNGINHWCEAGGIAGRGVLLDWLAWRLSTRPNEEPPSPIERYEIPYHELEEVAKYQGLQGFEAGDILLVRTGFVKWHNGANESSRKKGTLEQATYIGVQASQEAVEWFWNQHFAAVGGDAVAFEAWPPTKGKTCLHEWFLAQWGMPIGEMFDLETLSRICQEQKRWTFFLTSAPLHSPGGVGTTPNAIAIF